jgi:hypothetical protein
VLKSVLVVERNINTWGVTPTFSSVAPAQSPPGADYRVPHVSHHFPRASRCWLSLGPAGQSLSCAILHREHASLPGGPHRSVGFLALRMTPSHALTFGAHTPAAVPHVLPPRDKIGSELLLCPWVCTGLPPTSQHARTSRSSRTWALRRWRVDLDG